MVLTTFLSHKSVMNSFLPLVDSPQIIILILIQNLILKIMEVVSKPFQRCMIYISEIFFENFERFSLKFLIDFL